MNGLLDFWKFKIMKTKKCVCGKSFQVKETDRRSNSCPECFLALRRERRREAHQQLPEAALDGDGMSRTEIASVLGLAEATVRETEAAALLKLRQRPELLDAWREWIAAGKPKPAVASVGERLLEFQERIVGWYEMQTNLLMIGETTIAEQCSCEIEPFHQKIGSVLQQLR